MSSYLYGSYINEMSNVSSTISNQDYIDLLESSLSFYEESDEEYLSEAAGDNIEITKKFVELRKKYRAIMKDLKKALKAAKKSRSNEDKKKVKQLFEEAKNILTQYEKEIREIPADSLVNILSGAFVNLIINLLSLLPIIIIQYFAGKKFTNTVNDIKANSTFDDDGISGLYKFIDVNSGSAPEFTAKGKEAIATVIGAPLVIWITELIKKAKVLIIIIKDAKALVNELNKRDSEHDIKYLNQFRTRILQIIEKYKNNMDKIEAHIEKL